MIESKTDKGSAFNYPVLWENDTKQDSIQNALETGLKVIGKYVENKICQY